MAPIAIDTVFVVRHGERLGKLLIITYSTSSSSSPLSTTTTTDHVSKAWQPDPAHGLWDPPLSDKGRDQANRTGQYLVRLMHDSNIDFATARIVIYTSPFQRCLDTALDIAQHFPCRNTTLRLELGLGEWMSEEFFSDPPSPATRLISRQQEALARKQLASYKTTSLTMPQVDYAHPSIANEFTYPESYTDMVKRLEKTRTHCLQQAKDKEIAIFVTHAICCHALLDGFRGKQTRPLEAPYCSVSRITHTKQPDTTTIHTPPPSPPSTNDNDDDHPWNTDLLFSNIHLEHY